MPEKTRQIMNTLYAKGAPGAVFAILCNPKINPLEGNHTEIKKTCQNVEFPFTENSAELWCTYLVSKQNSNSRWLVQ